MRVLIILLMVSLGAAQEIKRPTQDVDTGNAGCTGTRTTSITMPLSHDAAGMSTASDMVISGSTTTSYYVARTFKGWTLASQTYPSLTLKINSISGGAGSTSPIGGGKACLAYSIDGGHAFTSIRCDTTGNGWQRITNSITLTPTQDLTNLQVVACVQGNRGRGYTQTGPQGEETPPGTDDITIFDIWTEGTTSAPAIGTGSSAAHRRPIVTIN